MKKRIYLAGPMRGYPHHNYPVFNDAACELRESGWIVVSPKELSECYGYTDPDIDGNFADYAGATTNEEIASFIRQAVEAILCCDAIALLPGWQNSVGTQMEVAIAKMANKQIVELS